MQIAGWILQALALKEGALAVVHSVTTLSLVIALPLGVKVTHQQVSRRVIIGAVAMVAGIVLFLFVGSPQGGTSHPDAAAWWSAVLASVAVIGLLAGFGWHRTGAAKALLFGTAAGVCFALQAATTERRARYWTDLARARGRWGHRDGCLRALLTAERLAPRKSTPAPPYATWSPGCSCPAGPAPNYADSLCDAASNDTGW